MGQDPTLVRAEAIEFLVQVPEGFDHARVGGRAQFDHAFPHRHQPRVRGAPVVRGELHAEDFHRGANEVT